MTARLLILTSVTLMTCGCASGGSVARATPPEPASRPAVAPAALPEPAVAQAAPEPAAADAPSAPPAAEELKPIDEAPAPLVADESVTAQPTAPVEPLAEVKAEIEKSTTRATTSASTHPAAPSPDAAAEQLAASGPLAAFDAQLARLLQGQRPTPAGEGLSPDDRALVEHVIDAIASFRLTLRDATSLLTTRTAPLLELSERLHQQIPLSLNTLALCRTVTQFGVYDPFEPPRFTAGKETPIIVYCEVDHFRSSPAADGRWETRLSYEAVLYRDGEAAVSVIHKKPTSIIDRCRNRRRDFFLADRLTLPATLPVGKYVLKVTVIDQLANHVAERTAPILIAPN